jgi:hypothetical protein
MGTMNMQSRDGRIHELPIAGDEPTKAELMKYRRLMKKLAGEEPRSIGERMVRGVTTAGQQFNRGLAETLTLPSQLGLAAETAITGQQFPNLSESLLTPLGSGDPLAAPEVIPENLPERLLGAAFREGGASVVPALGMFRWANKARPGSLGESITQNYRTSPGGAAAAEAGAAAGGGTALEMAQEVLPESEWAKALSLLAGSGLGGYATQTASNLAAYPGNYARLSRAKTKTDARTGRSNKRRNVLRAGQALDVSIERRGMVDEFAAQKDKMSQRVPGLKLTFGEVHNDPIMLDLESDIAHHNRFTARDEMRRQANNRQLLEATARRVQEPGPAAAAKNAATDQRTALEVRSRDIVSGARERGKVRVGEREAAVTDAQRGLDESRALGERQMLEADAAFAQGTADLQPEMFPFEGGANTLEEIKTSYKARTAEERAAWGAVAKGETASTKNISNTAKEIISDAAQLSEGKGLNKTIRKLARGEKLEIDPDDPFAGMDAVEALFTPGDGNKFLREQETVKELLALNGNLAHQIRVAKAEGSSGELVRNLIMLQDEVLTTLDTIPGGAAAKARALTRKKHDDFTRSQIGTALGTKKDADVKVEPSVVLSLFVKADMTGNAAVESLDDLYRVADTQTVDDAIDSFVLYEMGPHRAGVLNANGDINAKALQRFIDRREHIWAKRPDLRKRLATARDAKEFVTQVTGDISLRNIEMESTLKARERDVTIAGRRADQQTAKAKRATGFMLRKYDRSVARYMLDKDPDLIVNNILRGGNQGDDMAAAIALVGPDGKESLRAGFMASLGLEGDEGFLNPKLVARYFKTNRKAARVLFSALEMNRIDQLIGYAKSAARGHNVSVSMLEHGIKPDKPVLTINMLLSRLYGIQRGVVGERFVASEIGARYVAKALKNMKKADVNYILQQAIVDPELMKTLMEMANKRNAKRIVKAMHLHLLTPSQENEE